VFLEHFTGFPAVPSSSALRSPSGMHSSSGGPDAPLLDPLLLGVLTAAVEDESADAYQQGFRDGLRTAALRPDESEASDALLPREAPDEGDWHR
jgi:hypothetical protein